MNRIIDICEVSENKWSAKYKGGYEVYTVRIVFNENGEKIDFSCSCQSDCYPCKHIPMAEKAIQLRIAQRQSPSNEKKLTVKQVLRDVSPDELYDFIIQKSKYDHDLADAIIAEFAEKPRNKEKNKYYDVLHTALSRVRFRHEDYYEREALEIEVLRQWFEKAKKAVDKQNFDDALMICKACIKEFADWLQEQDWELVDYLNKDYKTEPFKIMQDIVEKSGTEADTLFHYCKTELADKKYAFMIDEFYDFMMFLATKTAANAGEFIAMQDGLWKQIYDKQSAEATKILKRKVAFYKKINRLDLAEDIMEANPQVESFCRQKVDKLIDENKYTDAKLLIDNFLQNEPTGYQGYWNEYLLHIAQKENNTQLIRKTSYEFIQYRFEKKYYLIYKSTFRQREWAEAVENLILKYERLRRKFLNKFSDSAAEVMIAEKYADRLAVYVEKHLTIDKIEKYHHAFFRKQPQKTLELFRKAIDKYLENYLSQDKYEYATGLMKEMKKIERGKTVVKEMIGDYRKLYKNRRVLMDLLDKV